MDLLAVWENREHSHAKYPTPDAFWGWLMGGVALTDERQVELDFDEQE